jgi:hypothetical protein
MHGLSSGEKSNSVSREPILDMSANFCTAYNTKFLSYIIR